MFKPAKVSNTASANRLVRLWAARYCPDVSVLPAQQGLLNTISLIKATAREGRTETVAKARRLLQINCALASLETKMLSARILSAASFTEANSLAIQIEQIYSQMLEIYQRQPPLHHALGFMEVTSASFRQFINLKLSISSIQDLAIELEPALLQFQQEHVESRDPHMLGFISAQFHFGTRKILKHLTIYEQVLLEPYLTFVEEQVCMPWQRVCAAAGLFPPNSPSLTMIEQLLPISQDISINVYQQFVHLYPASRSRRGWMTVPEIRASVLRDLNMFQAYLWLCVLEGEMTAIEQELLPLCLAVLPRLDISWQWVMNMVQLLVREIHTRVNVGHQDLLRPYTRALAEAFKDPDQQTG